jgi:hypothetical protein
VNWLAWVGYVGHMHNDRTLKKRYLIQNQKE